MRGKASLFQLGEVPAGITPAYAGKRGIYQSGVCSRQDHPRLCGEKGMEKKLHICFMGSPPPMRGKVLHDISCSVVLGITPAYAGKSLQPEAGFQIRQDHPRLCGEKHSWFVIPFSI